MIYLLSLICNLTCTGIKVVETLRGPVVMFRTVGDDGEFGDDGGTSYGSEEDDSRSGFARTPDDLTVRGPGTSSNSFSSFDNNSNYGHGLDTSEGSDSPTLVRKMFWHPSRIDKVQELVPEEVRSVLMSYC